MNRAQQGFSLIEIMVVLAMMLILSTSGMFACQRWQAQQRLWQTVKQLRHYLTLLRDDASWYNREHRLWLLHTPHGECLRGTLFSPEQQCRPRAFRQFTPPWPDVHIVSMTDGLAFFGLRNTAWPGHLRVCNRAGEWRVLISVWGRIRIEENRGEPACS